MHKLRAYVDDNMVVHLFPRNPLEVPGLRYLVKEVATHGTAVIRVEEDPNVYKQIKARKAAEE